MRKLIIFCLLFFFTSCGKDDIKGATCAGLDNVVNTFFDIPLNSSVDYVRGEYGDPDEYFIEEVGQNVVETFIYYTAKNNLSSVCPKYKLLFENGYLENKEYQ